MSAQQRKRLRAQRPATFDGEVQAFPDEELQGAPTALAMAIAEAATEAARYLADNGIDEADFEVSRIRIKVAKNPGPTSYSATITHI